MTACPLCGGQIPGGTLRSSYLRGNRTIVCSHCDAPLEQTRISSTVTLLLSFASGWVAMGVLQDKGHPWWGILAFAAIAFLFMALLSPVILRVRAKKGTESNPQ